ncbi:MAG TPA: TonB family protein [Terriglobales bacterium]|nr:TonB family protein [Terriglobales bacterium]
MAASADIFFEHDSWRRPLTWSAILHGVLFATILLYSAFHFPGESWGAGTGTGGDAMSVQMVSTIPLPASPIKTQNVLANESTGLSQSVPKPKILEEPTAIAIPEREAKRKPREKIPSVDRARPIQPIPEASNVVPYGEGGPVTNLYGFTSGGAKGGFNFTGAGGDFGSRYGWYVNAMRNKISENWLKYEIDPRISTAARCYVTFDITRSGQPTNVRVEQSSGVPSLDQSAVRALQRIDTFGPLPADYSGGRVSVEFWFDYHR